MIYRTKKKYKTKNYLPPAIKFECISFTDEEQFKINGGIKNVQQGIRFKDSNKFIIGIDAWRLLNDKDTCSYPLKRYFSKNDVLNEYRIIKTPKPYYLPELQERSTVS